MDSPFYLPPNLLPYPLHRIQEGRAASPLPSPSPWEKPHGLIPRSEHLRYLHPPHPLHPVPPQPPFIGSTPNSKYTHSYLSSTRRFNFSPRLPHTRLTCPKSSSRISSANTTCSPRFSPSACKAPRLPLFTGPLRPLLCFLRHRPGHLLPIAPMPKPVVQLLV
jgi:hypothetical protein